jgi:hypothetical protein
LIGQDHIDSHLFTMPHGDSQQTVIGGHEPSCRGSFGECKMQRIERAESKSDERSGAFADRQACGYGHGSGLKPELCCKPPVLARIASFSKS